MGSINRHPSFFLHSWLNLLRHCSPKSPFDQFCSREELTNGDIGTLGTMLNSQTSFQMVSTLFCLSLGPNQLFSALNVALLTVPAGQTCRRLVWHLSWRTQNWRPLNGQSPYTIQCFRWSDCYHHTDRDWIDLISNATETHVIEVNEEALHQANDCNERRLRNWRNRRYQTANLPQMAAVSVKE